jgi:hypothetical protein
MIRRWYAGALMGAHRNDDAKYQLDLAVQELHLLGNDFMAQRIEGQYSYLIKSI